MTPENTGKNIGAQGMPVLNVGNPGNKGGPGRTPNELRQLARESMPLAIQKANDIIAGKKGTLPPTPAEVIRAGEFLSKLAVPTQSEVIEIKDDQVIQWMYETLNELNCTPEFITEFKEKMDAKSQR